MNRSILGALLLMAISETSSAQVGGHCATVNGLRMYYDLLSTPVVAELMEAFPRCAGQERS